MNKTLFVSLILASLAVSAKNPPVGAISPAYRSLKMMDVTVETLAKGGGKTGLATKKPGDVMMASANMTLNKSTGTQIISVDLGGQICSTRIIEHLPPKGISGASSYSSEVISCTRYLNIRAPDLMKYEDVRVALSTAAGKGKVNLSFSVVLNTGGLKVRLRN